jgi:hypothetical protein
MARNALGIQTEIWAGNTAAAERTPIEDFALGYTDEYNSSKFPDRRHLNDVLSRVSATCSDVNKFGAGLPWHTTIPFQQYALTTGSNGVLYVATQANQGRDPTVSGNRPAYWIAVLTELQNFIDASTTKAVTPNAVKQYVDPYCLNESGLQIYNDGKANYAWHTLNLSSIPAIGTNKTMAHIKVETNGSAYGAISFKTYGSVESWSDWNMSGGVRHGTIWTYSPPSTLSVQVMTDASGRIEFQHGFSGSTSIRMTLEFYQRLRTA